MRRLRWHLGLATGSIAAAAGLTGLFAGDLRQRVSLGLAYVALALLAVTLALGPLKTLRGRPVPVSFDLRRDFGIWTAIVGLAHTAVGLTVHMRGRMHLYFLAPEGTRSVFGFRLDRFGLANDSGAVAAAVLVLLAGISGDWALRRLGPRRWKRIQQSAYILAGLTVVHTALYQWIENRRPAVILASVVLVAAGGALQGLGWRRRAPGARREGV